MFNTLNVGGGGAGLGGGLGGSGMGLGGFGIPAAVSNPETAFATQLEQLRVRLEISLDTKNSTNYWPAAIFGRAFAFPIAPLSLIIGEQMELLTFMVLGPAGHGLL